MLALLDSKIPHEAVKALQERGFSILKLPPHPALPTPIASHPDMLVFFAPDAIFCTESYASIAKKELQTLSAACNKPIRTILQKYGDRYPHDILLNAAPIGKRLFCLRGHTATELTEHPDFKICSVRQGYAKCSTVPVGEHALITEDPSIAAVAESEGLEVLRVAQNAVRLEGYSTGFLGGASSFSPYRGLSELFFCGSLDSHIDAKRISTFAAEHGFESVSLASFPLTDVGTMFFI